MSEQSLLPIAVQPVISYPREAEVGKTYLMTIDLQVVEGSEWQFEEEEYPIYCIVDSEPLFSCKAVGEPALSLHRFGGSYGAARFLLKTAEYELNGEITITIINCWGVPIQNIKLKNIEIKHENSLQKVRQDLTDQPIPIHWANQNTVQTVSDIPSNEITQTSIHSDKERYETIQNLPRTGIASFIGREQDLKHLHEILSREDSAQIFAISGIGGIGKTELAVQYANQQRELGVYPGGILWLDARENVGLQIVSFARSYLNLSLPELPDLRSLTTWCWRNFSNEPSLIVFDDVQDYQDIEAFLPPVESRFKVLLTTRTRIQAQAVSMLLIETLQPLQAYELLYQTVGDESRFEVGQVVAEELCEWLGYLPLGIELTAKFLKVEPDLPIAEVLAELQAEKLKHDGLTAIEVAFELSWEKLNAAERQLAMLLGGFGKAAIEWRLVDQAVEFCRVEWNGESGTQSCLLLEPKALQRGRRRLIELSLLGCVGVEQYQAHPLLREFFAGKRSQEEQRSMRTAIAQVMIAIAKQIPQTPTLENIRWVTGAIPHLQSVAEDLMQLHHRDECGIVDDTDLIWVFTGISRFYEGQGLYADAEPWEVACLKVARSLLGEAHPAVATSLNNLAELYQLQGRYEQAEPLYLHALQLRRSLLGDQHPDMAISLNNLANLYASQGRYEQAEPLYLQALQLQRSLLGDQHPNVARSLNNLAELYQLQGRYEQAEPLFLQALELRRSLLGENHPAVATSLNNLAELYWSQGRYEQAEPLFLQALELSRSLLGENHPDIASSLNNLALLYYSQGRYEQAEPLYLQALQLRRSLLGENHPDVATSLNNLAFLYQSQGRYEQAEPLYLHALQLRRSLLGEDHPDIATSLNNLALLYYSQGRYEQAEPLYLQALQLRQSLLGDQHPNVAASLNNLADLYCTQRRYEEAESLYVKALEINMRLLGKGHPHTQIVRDNLEKLKLQIENKQ